MKRNKKFLVSLGLALCALLLIILPASAALDDWWNPTVNVTLTAQLNPYKDTYWGYILAPGYLDCQSASFTVGNMVYIGTIKPWWWFFKSCDVTFNTVPANTTGILTMNYKANGNWTYQKSFYIGKTYWSTIRLPKILLPWSQY
jgi:hypothetical protein